jgi:hypothetical protein
MATTPQQEASTGVGFRFVRISSRASSFGLARKARWIPASTTRGVLMAAARGNRKKKNSSSQLTTGRCWCMGELAHVLRATAHCGPKLERRRSAGRARLAWCRSSPRGMSPPVDRAPPLPASRARLGLVPKPPKGGVALVAPAPLLRVTPRG